MATPGEAGNGETPEEIAIQKLRKSLGDVLKGDPMFGEDLFLLPFLKNNQLNVEKAAAEVQQSIKWRKEVNFTKLGDKAYNDGIQEAMPIHMDGVSKDGTPVASMIVGGDVDHVGIVEEYGKDRYLRYFMQFMAKAEKVSLAARKKMAPAKITGETKTGLIMISDVGDYSFTQAKSIAVIQAWVEMSQNYRKYCPGVISAMYILNMNKIFAPAFKMVKPWIEGPNLEMKLFEASDSTWKDQILQDIDAQQIRPSYGGTKDD